MHFTGAGDSERDLLDEVQVGSRDLGACSMPAVLEETGAAEVINNQLGMAPINYTKMTMK